MRTVGHQRNTLAIVLLSAVLGIGGFFLPARPEVIAAPKLSLYSRMRVPMTSSAQGKTTPVKRGVWGGQSISFAVEQDAVRIEFDCAEGTIPRQLKADKAGHFKVDGTFTRHMPGPVRRDNIPRAEPAIYEGTIRGNAMSLKIWLTKTNESAGEFKIERGKTPVLFRCA